MDAGHQRQPFSLAPLASRSLPVARLDRPRRWAGLPVGIGAAVGGIVDHAVDRRVAGASPDDVAIAAPGGQIEPMFMKPQQRLPRAAEFADFLENQFDRRLDAPVRILLQTIDRFHEADGRINDEFAAPRFLAGRERALAKQRQFISLIVPFEHTTYSPATAV